MPRRCSSLEQQRGEPSRMLPDDASWPIGVAPTQATRGCRGRQPTALGAGAHGALPQVVYRARPALACIIGARRACTVEMISSEEMPCR